MGEGNVNDKAIAIRRDDLLPDAETWKTTTQMADAFFKSGLLPSNIKTPQAAALIIQNGRELNLPPTFALAHIHVIDGKPTTDAQVIGALIYQTHGDNALIPVASTAKAATYRYKRRGWVDWQEFSYTIEDARTANLLGKKNWRENPAAMLRARCVSAIGRLAFQDVVGGLYTGEEIAPDLPVNEHGGIISLREQPSENRPADEPIHEEPAPIEADYRPADPDPPARPTTSQAPTEDDPSANWNAFWRWARPKGYSLRSQVEEITGLHGEEATPSALYAALTEIEKAPPAQATPAYDPEFDFPDDEEA